jgi:hypothetical protein
MRVFCAALIVASLIVASLAVAGAAYAQEDDHVQRYGEKAKEKSQMEIQADKAAARAYQNSLKNIPDQGPVDPWGNARSAEAPKTAAKPATKSAAKTVPPKAAKTGTTAN